MAKADIGTFKQTAGAIIAAEHMRAHSEHDAMMARRVVEADCRGAILLFCLASMDAAIEGFPDRVALDFPNGYRRGLEAVRTQGTWHFGGTDQAVIQSCDTANFGSPYLKDVHSFGLRALDVKTTPATLDYMTEVTRPDIDAEQAAAAWLDDIMARLSPPSVRALAGYATALVQTLSKGGGVRVGAADVVCSAWRAAELFPGLSIEHAYGLPSPLLAASAAEGDLEAVHAMLRPSSVPEGRMAPSVRGLEGAQALQAALKSGRAPRVVEALLAAGASSMPLDGIYPLSGGTLMHFLAANAPLRDMDWHAAMVDVLVRGGVDPNAVDNYGHTARDIYEERIRSALIDEDMDSLTSTLRASQTWRALNAVTLEPAHSSSAGPRR